MAEPWDSVRRAALRSYVGLGGVLGIIAYGQFHLIGDPPGLEPCLAAYGFGPEQSIPAGIAYAAYKAVAWPVSLGWTLAEGEVKPLDWIFARYDPFAGACGAETADSGGS